MSTNKSTICKIMDRIIHFYSMKGKLSKKAIFACCISLDELRSGNGTDDLDKVLNIKIDIKKWESAQEDCIKQMAAKIPQEFDSKTIAECAGNLRTILYLQRWKNKVWYIHGPFVLSIET